MDKSYKSWAFTIRPRDGVEKDSPLQVAIIKWCMKQDYYFLCAEGIDEARHLHGQIWVDEPRDKGTINKSLERICEKHVTTWDTAQKKVLRGGTKIAYSSDFIETYLSKEDNWILNACPENEEDYYPSEEEQTKVKNAANAADKKYNRLSQKFKEANPDWMNYACAVDRRYLTAKFLSDAMFKSKTEMVIQDKRNRVALCQCLTAYIWETRDISMFMTDNEYEIWSQTLPNEN